MTQEDKELLLKDLCARLPYGVMCNRLKNVYELVDIDIKRGLVYLLRDDTYVPYSITMGDEVKPYLRPMSSMTEEEYTELKKISEYYGFAPFEYIYDWGPNYNMTDWLNANHFDYRGLIPKDLAIEVTEENNPYKD